jgi:putative transposase
VADLTLENRLLKKSMIGDGERRRMRYPASEKLEIIRLVEQSHLPVKQTLAMLGIPAPPSIAGMTGGIALGPGGLEDGAPAFRAGSGTVSLTLSAGRSSSWRSSSRAVAARTGGPFTDEKRYFVSEASVSIAPEGT